MINSMMRDLSTIKTPDVFYDKTIIKKENNPFKSGYEYTVQASDEQSSYVLNFSNHFYIKKEFLAFNKDGSFTKSDEINKYLRFKVISFVDQGIMKEYTNSIKLLLREGQEGSCREYGLSDFVPAANKLNFFVKYNNFLPISNNNHFLGLVYFTYYDLEQISKDFSIDLTDVVDIEQYFIGKVNEEIIVLNGKFVNKAKIIDIHGLENVILPDTIKKEYIEPKTHYSSLFISQDILLKNIGIPCEDDGPSDLSGFKKPQQKRQRKISPRPLQVFGED